MSETGRCGTFQVVHRAASCFELARELPLFDERTALIAGPTDRAVIFGSMRQASAEHEHRCHEAGFDVVQRQSGGGAVVIVPEEVIWVDLFLPKQDPLFQLDVRTGSFWVGELWQEVAQCFVGTIGTPEVHRGGLVEAPWSRECCFLGLGPGEVTIGGSKFMGLSQRRTRDGAWFFSLVYRTLQAERDAALLASQPSDVQEIAGELSRSVATLPYAHGEITDTLLACISRID